MSIKKLMRFSRTLLKTAMLAAVIAPGISEAKTVELKVGFYQNQGHIFVDVAERTLPELEKLTDGRYKFGIYTSETLGKAPEQIDTVNRGLVFASLICTCYYPGTFPLFNIETVPIWTSGVDGVRNTFEGGLNDLYERYLHSRGLTNVGFLGATAYSVRSLGTKEKQTRTPDDLNGLRVRGLGYERFLIEKSGAAVLTMPMPQVMEGLERNMLDGVMAQESNWIDWKLYESVNHINFLDLTTSPMSVIYSIKDLEKISEEDRSTVLQVLNNFKSALANEYATFMDDGRDFLINEWEGIAHHPTTDEKRAFVELVRDDAIQEYLSRAGDMGPEAVELVTRFNQ